MASVEEDEDATGDASTEDEDETTELKLDVS